MKQRIADLLQGLLPTGNMRKVPQDRWVRMDPAEKVEELTGHSLDNCRDILDLPLEMAVRSPNVMHGKVQIIRAILSAVTKVGIESSRLRQMQDELLGKLIEDFDAAEKPQRRTN